MEIVARFLREEYAKAGLNSLAQMEKHEVITREEADEIIDKIAAEANLEREEIEEIIKFIVLQGRVTRDQIKTKFGLSEHKQVRPLLATLSSENLIRSGRGLYCEPKLIQLYKVLFYKDYKDYKVRKEGVGSSRDEKSRGVFSDLVNHVNLVSEKDKTKATLSGMETEIDIDLRRVKRIKRLDRILIGFCDNCSRADQNRKVPLVFKVETLGGGVLLLCEACGQALLKALGEGLV